MPKAAIPTEHEGLPVATSAFMRELDRLAAEQGLDAAVLMDKAGRAVAVNLLHRADRAAGRVDVEDDRLDPFRLGKNLDAAAPIGRPALPKAPALRGGDHAVHRHPSDGVGRGREGKEGPPNPDAARRGPRAQKNRDGRYQGKSVEGTKNPEGAPERRRHFPLLRRGCLGRLGPRGCFVHVPRLLTASRGIITFSRHSNSARRRPRDCGPPTWRDKARSPPARRDPRGRTRPAEKRRGRSTP